MNSTVSFIADLRKYIGDVLDDEYSLGMYATDASHYQILPVAIVLPKNEAEVKKQLRSPRNLKIKEPTLKMNLSKH
jgi:FAD/FMN-containing dehydrogenase